MVRKKIKKVAKVSIRIAKYVKQEINRELCGLIKKGSVSARTGARLARSLAREAINVARKIDVIISKELARTSKKKRKKKKKKKLKI